MEKKDVENIGLAAPYFHPHVGGVESHVYELAKHLSARGYTVEVLTSNSENVAPEEPMDGFVVRRAKCWGKPFTTPIAPGIKKLVRQGDYDLIHVHTPPPITDLFVLSAARKQNVPSVLTYHCDLELEKIGKYAVGLYNRALQRRVLSMADSLVVTTTGYGRTSRSVWHIEPHVVPNAVDPTEFHPQIDGVCIRDKLGLDRDDFMVLFVGRLVPHKGVQHLIDAVAVLNRDMGKKAYLVVVGKGPHEIFLRERARKVRCEKVIFAGRVSREDLPRYYAAADVFVLPSISRLEAFGIVTLEAMASGKPVLVSNIPGVRDVVDDGVEGLIIEPLDPKGTAKKIAWVMEHPEEARRMGEMGRKKVEEKYNWSKVVEMILNVYRETVRKKRR